MASSHHTGRRPQRISSITARSPRFMADSRRVSEADMRPAIYVRPKGAGYHVVKNVCNDQQYVVADGTAGATFTPGQVVSVASFTGNPGEFIIARPPAGFGGASAYAIARVSAGYPGAETENDLPVGTESETWTASRWCFDPYSECVLEAGWYTRTFDSGATTRWWIGVQAYSRGSLPVSVAQQGTGTRLAEVEVANSPSGALLVVADGAGRIAVLYYDEADGGTYGRRYRWSSWTSDGSHLATVSYIGPTFWVENHDWCLSDSGSVYAIEPREADEPFSGPPFSSGVRVTRRNLATLSVEAGYDFPSVSPYDGLASRGQWPISVNARSGGGVHVHFYNVEDVGPDDSTYWRRNLDATLSFVSDEAVGWDGGKGVYLYSPGAGHCVRRIGANWYCLGGKAGTASATDIWRDSGLGWQADVALDGGWDVWIERGIGGELIVEGAGFAYSIQAV